MQFEEARSAANRDRFKPGALDQNIFRGEGNFRVGAAHDAAEPDGARAVAVGDDANARGKYAFDLIERFDFLVGPAGGNHVGGGLCRANNDAVIADFVVVVRVERLAEFEHYVVRDVDDVVDAGDAGRFETFAEPGRRGLDFYAANYPGGEAAAEFRDLNFDLDCVAGPRRAFCGFRQQGFQRQFVDCGDFAGDAVVAQTIGAIGGDLGVDHCTVRAFFDAADVGAGEREARGEFVGGRGYVDEIFQPVVDDLHAGFLSAAFPVPFLKIDC